LAEDVASDLDMPPFDKALMDGYALRTADLLETGAILTVVEEIPAGQTPQKKVGVGQAARIMTGAAMPAGADAVVMIERTELLEGQRVRIHERPAKAGQNILPRGREMRSGETVLAAGAVLRPQEFGLLATVGKATFSIYRQPRVALLSTGDEVVEPPGMPGPGQIRNSNASMLMAQIARAGGLPFYLGIARDTLESLRPLVIQGLTADCFLLSGGVSAGKFDLVPGVLQELGVEPIFHKVAMKPGKPFYFGVRGETLVFGLPGNPVSSLVGFELFVRPSIRVARGCQQPGPRLLNARLATDYIYKTDRPTYHPAHLEAADNGFRVTPVPWFGSPDLRAVTQANVFAVFPVGENRLREGETVSVLAPELDW
jgi:molybdopterin molybdotransferase